MADGVCHGVQMVHRAEPTSSFSMDGKTYRLGESNHRPKPTNEQKYPSIVYVNVACHVRILKEPGESTAKSAIFTCYISASLAGHQLKILSFASFISNAVHNQHGAVNGHSKFECERRADA